MSIIAWIVLGLAAGLLAGLALGGGSRMVVASAVVGTLGAVLGGFIASVLLGLDVVQIDPTGLVLAFVGALVLIGMLRAVPDAQTFE
jgi:uncharacterized membrane protein YeaQ/YmgE (transglycosylase-associated protein family)